MTKSNMARAKKAARKSAKKKAAKKSAKPKQPRSKKSSVNEGENLSVDELHQVEQAWQRGEGIPLKRIDE